MFEFCQLSHDITIFLLQKAALHIRSLLLLCPKHFLLNFFLFFGPFANEMFFWEFTHNLHFLEIFNSIIRLFLWQSSTLIIHQQWCTNIALISNPVLFCFLHPSALHIKLKHKKLVQQTLYWWQNLRLFKNIYNVYFCIQHSNDNYIQTHTFWYVRHPTTCMFEVIDHTDSFCWQTDTNSHKLVGLLYQLNR